MENLTTWLLTQTPVTVVLGIATYVLWRQNKKLTDIIIEMTKDTVQSADNVADKLEDTINFLKDSKK